MYVLRSQQLYTTTPPRTKLFTWSMTQLEIMALADTSYHGKENVVKHMREIDNERYVSIIFFILCPVYGAF